MRRSKQLSEAPGAAVSTCDECDECAESAERYVSRGWRARAHTTPRFYGDQEVLPRGVATTSWSLAVDTTDVVSRNRRFNPRGGRIAILRGATPVKRMRRVRAAFCSPHVLPPHTSGRLQEYAREASLYDFGRL